MTNLPVHLNVAQARLPDRYGWAKAALAECQRVDECKDWADKAAAMASYTRQSDDDTLYEMAVRIKSRAIRRGGQSSTHVMGLLGSQRPNPLPKLATRENGHFSQPTLSAGTRAVRPR